MAMVLGIMSGVTGAMGALQEGRATASAAEYNEAVAKQNARVVTAQTEAEMDDKRLENRRQMASLRAAYGSSGLMLDGSPLDVLEDTAVEQAYDVSKMRYQGRVKALGYKQQAKLFKMEGEAAVTASYIGAASQMISGVQTGLRDWSGGGGGGGSQVPAGAS